MVTYLPTILMNMINQATNYITTDTKGGSHIIFNIMNEIKNKSLGVDEFSRVKLTETFPKKFDLIMTVNITCMMVLASVYLYVSGSLPSTSDIKPVEVWLIFNLVYPCFIILSNVLLQVRILNIFIIDTHSLS